MTNGKGGIVMTYTIQKKKCPDGVNCPLKELNACKAIKSMPEYLKGQETANTGFTEQEQLYRYERTGITPNQLEALLEHLKGECWLCEHSKPYEVSPTRKLSVCELGFPDRTNTIAMIRDKECKNWKLKQFEDKTNG